jgi:M6 family metalloprotease-like protein
MKLYHRILAVSCLMILAMPLSLNGVHAVVSQSSYRTLLEDDFSQGLAKWHPVAGNWVIQNGELQGASNQTQGIVSAGDTSWTDYILSVRVKSLTNSTDILLVRFQDSSNYYRLILLRDHMEIWLRRQGSDQLIYRETPWGYSLQTTDWHDVRVKIYGTAPTITAYIDNYPEITVKDLSGQAIPNGMVGLSVNRGTSSAFRAVKTTTLHPDSTGAQRIILLLVEFPDVKHNLTSDQVYQDVFPKLNQYYTQVSYNQTWIVGAVTSGWKILLKPSSYYDIAKITGSGLKNGRDIEFLKDAILAWDNETDYRKYDYVFVAGPRNSVWGYTWFQVLIAKTNDGITVTAATAQSENQAWDVYAHEFSHLSLGLPDLYSYAIAFSGPPDYRQAAIYVGPWDLMSRADPRPGIGAWGKIHVGWISQDRILEIHPGKQGAATVIPLEESPLGTQAILVYVSPTTYFVIENREQIGFDSGLPDKGILVTYVDEGKYWLGNGPVVVQDANPGSGPRWQLPHPTFDVGPTAKPQYTNGTFNLSMSLLDKFSNGSYVIAVGRPDSMDAAKSAYLGLSEAADAIQKATAAGRAEGLDQARVSLAHARQQFSSGSFEQALASAEQSKATANAAATPSQTQQDTSRTAMVYVVLAVIVAAGAFFLLKRKRARGTRSQGAKEE